MGLQIGIIEVKCDSYLGIVIPASKVYPCVTLSHALSSVIKRIYIELGLIHRCKVLYNY